VKPIVEVRSKRIGGANYQVPIQVNKQASAVARVPLDHPGRPADKGRPMAERLAEELWDAGPKRGQGDEHAGADAPHGRGEQGIQPLRILIN
jgi:small subunit ribosomal protein S7